MKRFLILFFVLFVFFLFAEEAPIDTHSITQMKVQNPWDGNDINIELLNSVGGSYGYFSIHNDIISQYIVPGYNYYWINTTKKYTVFDYTLPPIKDKVSSDSILLNNLINMSLYAAPFYNSIIATTLTFGLSTLCIVPGICAWSTDEGKVFMVFGGIGYFCDFIFFVVMLVYAGLYGDAYSKVLERVNKYTKISLTNNLSMQFCLGLR